MERGQVSVWFLDGATRRPDRLQIVRPTRCNGLAERFADVSEAGRDLFVAMTIEQGVPVPVPQTGSVGVSVVLPPGLGTNGGHA
jgi:hypothetical protein